MQIRPCLAENAGQNRRKGAASASFSFSELSDFKALQRIFLPVPARSASGDHGLEGGAARRQIPGGARPREESSSRTMVAAPFGPGKGLDMGSRL